MRSSKSTSSLANLGLRWASNSSHSAWPKVSIPCNGYSKPDIGPSSGVRRTFLLACGQPCAHGRHLPPSVDGLVAWSQLFRNAKTYGAYVNYLRHACFVENVSSESTDSPAVKRAKAAVRRRQGPPRPKRAITGKMLGKLMARARDDGDTPAAMLYLTAYVFLLRVPSEGLPLTIGSTGETQRPLPAGRHSAIEIMDGELVFSLAKRKNLQGGSTLRRACSCSVRADLCPVHVLGPCFMQHPPGSTPFAHLSADRARVDLKARACALGWSEPHQHSLQDFRRGHAQDMVDSGSPLAEILRAGQWKSPAFLLYLDINKMEACLAVASCVAESDDEE